MKKISYLLVSLVLGNVMAQQLTKDEAIRLVLENNYGVKVARNATEIAENNKGILNSGYLPSVTANAEGIYNLDNTEAEFSNGNITTLKGAESNRYNASVNLNYTLFDGLGRYYNYKQLKEQYNLSGLEARQTIENTILQLFTIYYSVGQLTENVVALEEVLQISKKRIQRAEYQFEYGQDTKLGVLNAQVDHNNDQVNLLNVQQQLGNAQRDLKVVLGTEDKPEFVVDTTVNFVPILEKESLWEQAQKNNVALLQAEQQVLLSGYVIKSNKAAYLPIIGLSGSYGWNRNNNNAAAFVATQTSNGLSGGVNLSWNIFDGGRSYTQVQNAKIALENNELQKKQLHLELSRDFNNSWEDYQNKLTIFEIQQQNISTAKNNFERTEGQFKLGQTTSIEFRQAQTNLLNAILSSNQAKYDAKLAELQVLQLSGQLLEVEF